MERRLFVSVEQLLVELGGLELPDLDFVTFSGMGEPTLAANLGEAVEAVREELGYPVAVLTNSSLMLRDDVRRELALADLVVAKLDASTDELFGRINHPVASSSFCEVVEGIAGFGKEYWGKLALQMMFLEANADRAREMAALARKLCPREVQLNTPLRPSAVRPLSRQEMEIIACEFRGMNALNVYEAEPVEVDPVWVEETLRRRPD
jgi:wyosine [tRNA(Phe)-imidazoG37] synthetase (radical SAM superfamily)